ncbi:hypothetical protein CBM2585_A90037 [Cupriavidus taiwanensis]|nr:hypothetical protein CBM2585_A90037 [Cupriavidus taiwanensis]
MVHRRIARDDECAELMLDFVDAPALSPAPLPQAGEGRKQAGNKSQTGRPRQRVRAQRRTPCPSHRPEIGSARSAAEGVPPIT